MIVLALSVIFILTILSSNLVAVITPIEASLNSTLQGLNDSVSQNTTNLTDVAVQANQTLAAINQSAAETLAAINQSAPQRVNITEQAREAVATQVRDVSSRDIAGAGIVSGLILAIAVFIVIPLLFGMYLTYRQDIQMGARGKNIFRFGMQGLYRVLVAIGVIFAVILIIVYLNALISFNITIQSEALDTLLETQNNFITIIGTAFASLVAFYFGTRATQSNNAERAKTITGPETAQKSLEVMDVSPIDGTVGVEVDSPVTATFSAPIRGSTINANTYSVKDANGNPVQGKITLTDNNTTIKFNPVPSFNQNNRYIVMIAKGIMDVSGASLTADMEWHFTTVM